MTDPGAEDLRWTVVGRASEWPESGARLVNIGARRIGVYRYLGRWYALKDICPHAGVGLSRGPIANGAVTCLGHGWSFDLATGAVVRGSHGFAVATYAVREVDGTVEVGC